MAKSDVLNIYQNRSNLKWIVLFAATVISAGSIFYTNVLVDKLKERERSFIRLYATTLEYVLDESVTITQDINFISEQIILQNSTIPMIILDSMNNVIDYKNVDVGNARSVEVVDKRLKDRAKKMADVYDPIVIAPLDPATGEPYLVQYLYYENSSLLTQLTYYPFIQLSVIAIFGFIAYLGFSYSRTAEQNRVWVGMAKETAHQLGTPISSLIAWLEYLKTDEKLQNHEVLNELNKDIQKLELITERFSSIGSIPVLRDENVIIIVNRVVDYLKSRISSKVVIHVSALQEEIYAQIHPPLFEWVIENIIKNAVDAMGGEGRIEINIIPGSDYKVFVDINDTGKGIPASKMKTVFNPGYTTKKRGWGLGLALASRIVENYHRGKIFVKSSEIDVGTTFRIVLNRTA